MWFKKNENKYKTTWKNFFAFVKNVKFMLSWIFNENKMSKTICNHLYSWFFAINKNKKNIEKNHFIWTKLTTCLWEFQTSRFLTMKNEYHYSYYFSAITFLMRLDLISNALIEKIQLNLPLVKFVKKSVFKFSKMFKSWLNHWKQNAIEIFLNFFKITKRIKTDAFENNFFIINSLTTTRKTKNIKKLKKKLKKKQMTTTNVSVFNFSFFINEFVIMINNFLIETFIFSFKFFKNTFIKTCFRHVIIKKQSLTTKYAYNNVLFFFMSH